MHKCKVMESHLELLNIWINRNYNREKERLSLRYGMYFSEDIFIESYMLARNEIKHCDICNKEMSEVLMDCYKRISYKYYVQKMRYVNPDQLFFDFLKDDDEYKDRRRRYRKSTLRNNYQQLSIYKNGISSFQRRILMPFFCRHKKEETYRWD